MAKTAPAGPILITGSSSGIGRSSALALHALAGGDRTEPQRVAEHRAALVRAVGQLAAQRP